MSARKPAASVEAPDEEKVVADPIASAEAAPSEADASAAPAEEVAPEIDKDAEIARLRAEAAESQAKLEALLAGQSVGEPVTAEPVEGEVEVKMLVTISGLRNGAPWPIAGGTITVPADEAAQLVANGYAIGVE